MAKSVFSLIFKGKDQTKGAFASISKSAGQAAKAVAAVSAVAGTAFLVGAIRSSRDFEEQMKKVSAVSGSFGDELAALKKTAEDLGATTRFTATQAAQGLEELARAGQTAEEAIATLPNALFLAQGNAIELADAAQLVTTTLNQYQLAADDSVRVSDVLTAATQGSAQNIEQLGNALEFAGPQAKQVGLTLEETTAIIGKLADVGFRGEKGGTALRNALIELSNPASKFSEELLDLGITSTNFVEVLGELEKQGDGASQAFIDLGKRAGPAIAALVGGGTEGIGELIAELETSQGTALETARIMDDNLAGATKGLESAFDALQRAVADPILDPLTTEAQELAKILRALVEGGDAAKFGQQLATMASFALKGTNALIGLTTAAFGFSQEFAKTNLAKISNEFADVNAQILNVGIRLGEATRRYGENSAVVLRLTRELRNLTRRKAVLEKQIRTLNSAGQAEKDTLDAITTAAGSFIDGVIGGTKATGEFRDVITEAEKEAATFQKKVDDLIGSLNTYDSQLALINAAQDQVNALFRSGDIDISDYISTMTALDEQVADLIPNLDKEAEALKNVATAGVEAADEITTAFDALFDFLPDGVRQAAQALTSGFQGIGSGVSSFLFGQALPDGQAGPPAPGAFGGLFGSGGQPSNFFGGALGGAGLGGAIGGGSGAIGGALLGGIGNILLPGIGGAIGSVVGGLLGGLFGGDDEPTSNLIFGSSAIDSRNNPGSADRRGSTGVGDFLVRSGRDGFIGQVQGAAFDAVDTVLDSIAALLTPEELARAGQSLSGLNVNLSQENIESGAFLDPVLDRIISALDPSLQSLVGGFDNLDDQLQAIASGRGFLDALDTNAVEVYNQAVLDAGRTQQEILSDQVSSVSDFLGAFDGSIAQMQEGTSLLQNVNASIVQVLAGLDAASSNISAITGSTIDNLRFQALAAGEDPEGAQFDFLTRRAEQLAGEISGLGSADEVQRQIQLINQLVAQAAGIGTPEQLAELLPEFEEFLTTSESAGQARLEELREQTVAINDQLQDVATQFSDSIGTMAVEVGNAVLVAMNNSGLVESGSNMIKASNSMNAAANKLQTIDIRVTIDQETGAIGVIGR